MGIKNDKIFHLKKFVAHKIESVTFKMTHFVFHVTQKRFIIWMLHVRVSLLLHIMKNKMCHFETFA